MNARAIAAALEVTRRDGATRGCLALDPETVGRHLARRAPGVLECLSRRLEMQAIRRMERGAPAPEEEGSVGDTPMRASARLGAIAAAFGTPEEDLSLDPGPLDRLVCPPHSEAEAPPKQPEGVHDRRSHPQPVRRGGPRDGGGAGTR